jgi:large subunit ribosomal protein L22
MKITAHHKNARMSPRKLRLLRNALIGLPAVQAQAQLKFMSGKAAQIIGQVLNSAVANAKHNFEVSAEDLTISEVTIDGALTFKRSMPRSKGMANQIIKRNSHVTIAVDDGSKNKEAKGKKTDITTISVDDAIKQVATRPATSATHSHSQRDDASKSIKTRQPGGDQAKTHRRKSMSDA